MSLIERESVQDRLDGLLAGAARGEAVVAVLGGPTATGKTALLRELAERAAEAGTAVLSATAASGERLRPLSTVGQLLDPDGLAADADADGTAAGAAEPARRLHAAVTELAARSPVLLVVDDLQHADEESLRCLRYLTHRLGAERVAIVLSWEQQLGEDQSATLRELIYRPNVRWLHLRPLSPDGTRRLVRDVHGRAAADTAADAYHALSGGNPLLATALLADNDPLGAEPGTHAGPAYAQALLVCLHRMGPLVGRIARDLALLDDPVDPHLLGRLSEVGSGMVRRALQYLTDVGVLDGTRFRHPAARQAILDGLPAGQEAGLRRRAACLLHDEGAPAQAIARHLLVAGPVREDWVPPVLSEAAWHALVDDDVARAIRCLQIAGESCTSETERYSAKARLAAVRWLVKPATSAPSFAALRAPIAAGRVRPECALDVAQAMLWFLRFDEATEAIERVAGDPEVLGSVAEAYQVTRLSLDTMFPGVLPRLRTSCPATGDRPPSMVVPELRSLEILSAVLRQSADDHTIAQAEQVLLGSRASVGALMAIGPAILSLVYTDRLESAAAWCDRFLAETGAPDGSDGRSGAWRAFLTGFSAVIALRTGHLDTAVERSRRVLDQVGRNGWNATSVLAVATLAEALTALGDHAAAAELFADPVPAEVFKTTVGLHYLYARGRHHLATDREHAALADFMACGEHMLHWNIDTPALAPWRVAAAEAWLKIGDRDRAADLVTEQLGQFRADLPRAFGKTLRVLAAVSAPDKRPAILSRSQKLLERGGARYELARVLTDLGEAYHQQGDRARAQTATRRARRLAKNCNAHDLYEEAPALYSPATRPPGGSVIPMQYNDAYGNLSDSERRVALLAVQGLTNREIAGKLFITVSTVEQHLTRVYRKMNVRNREELPTVLRLDGLEAV
ncbi:helix-turn-helix transcriptional regulator [Actinomadura rupiterrae]|uniref:helix-turn-helix transcriptional regulator n=1 Tax=Actinomadura rupiterrae TaxID=559627 RepID=UPI0020A2B113|nr:LuxR family transcriptional regulator [Actinomadura rupiterrae]MCP2342746.1 DNA-binding CsgD family transcriptional regulator/type II secretory pathway predicted ATPase ExeA [Actinomadura rupiterrae]